MARQISARDKGAAEQSGAPRHAPSPAVAGGAHGAVLALQRTAGNRSVAAMLRARTPTAPGPPRIQRKAGDVSRPDFDLMAELKAFLAATGRNKATLFPPLKDRLKTPGDFKSAELRKIAIRFQTAKVEDFVNDKGKICKAVGDLADAVSNEYESDRKTQAQGLEALGGGHSLDRHGPEVTDVALQLRLTTGVAPDNQISVAPGYSSKFNSHVDWVDTRQRAIDALVSAAGRTQARLIRLAPRFPAAKQAETTAQGKVDAATLVKQGTHIDNQRARGRMGEGSDEHVAAQQADADAAVALGKAQAGQAKVTSEIGAMIDSLALPVEKAQVDLANIASFRVKRAYRVIVDNPNAIGTGWEGTGAQAPQQITHGGRTVDDAVLYAGTRATAPLTKSLTTLDGGPAAGTPLLVAGAGVAPPTPNPALNVAAWNVVQHFPAPPDATAGIE